MLSPAEDYLVKLKDLLLRPTAFVVSSILLIVFLLLPSTRADYDLFARLAVGRLIEGLGYVPLQDPFAFTVRKPFWIDHEWLSGIVFYQIWNLAGEQGLFAIKYGLMAATVILLVAAQNVLFPKKDVAMLFWSYLLLAQAAFLWASTVRCQIFTYFFIALYLYVFVADFKKRDLVRLWLCPFSMLIWCNLHGGFVVGLGFLCLYLLIASHKRKNVDWMLFLICCLSLFATALTPYGPFLFWGYILEAISMPRPSISEWHALTPVMSGGILAYASLLLVVFTCRSASYLKIFFPLLAFSALFGFLHVRLFPIFCFSCFVLGADALSKLLDFLPVHYSSLKSRLSIAFSPVVLIACIYSLFLTLGSINTMKLTTEGYPKQALDWLANSNARGKLLVDFNNGSFALWKLFPRFFVSLDGRYEELYPNSTVDLVSAALDCTSPRQMEALKQVNADFILVSSVAKCWGERANTLKVKTVYSDAEFAILQRL